jgi:hypothetical protein
MKGNIAGVLFSDTVGGRNLEIVDVGTENVPGGHYTFFKDRFLKSYYFIAKTDTSNAPISTTAELVEPDPIGSGIVSYSTYIEIFDSTGKVEKSKGSPLVHQHIKVIRDSVHVALYFFSLNKDYKDFQITDKQNNQYSFKVQKDSVYSNMKRLTFGYKSKGEKSFLAYIQTEYKNKCTSAYTAIRDTIDLEL